MAPKRDSSEPDEREELLDKLIAKKGLHKPTKSKPAKQEIPEPDERQELMDNLIAQKGLHKPTKVKPSKPESLAEHTVAAGDSLSKIAAQYYGDGSAEKWKLIYEANKETIGDNPNLIRPGQVFKIPPLEKE